MPSTREECIQANLAYLGRSCETACNNGNNGYVKRDLQATHDAFVNDTRDRESVNNPTADANDAVVPWMTTETNAAALSIINREV